MDNNLFETNNDLVMEAANKSWEAAMALPVGSKERASAIEDASKVQTHIEKLLDANNRAAEMEARLEADAETREHNRKLDLAKAEDARRWKKVDTAVKCAEIATTAGVGLWCCRSQLKTYWNSLVSVLKYEKDGSILSNAGRTTASGIGKILKFK